MQYNKQSNLIPLFENFCRQNQVDGKTISANIGDKSLKLVVAATPESMISGYSNKPCPKEGEGMIFIYPKEEPLFFWMKDVNYQLDILFFDSMMNLVDHFTMDACGNIKDEELPRYESSKPARFAVEVPGGWCKSNGIDRNCRLKF